MPTARAEGQLDFASAARCIYCGATRYSSKRENLGDEHIIPFALAGNLIIPEASCQACEAKISRFERPLSTGPAIAPVRYALGFPSKRPKNRPERYDVTYFVDGVAQVHSVPVEEMPVNIALHGMHEPGIFRGERPDASRSLINDKIMIHPMTSPGSERFLSSIGAQTWSQMVIGDNVYFPLLIAKVAYGVAYGQLGGEFGLFDTVILPIFMGDKSRYDVSYLVGGLVKEWGDLEAPIIPPMFGHRVAVYTCSVSGVPVLFVFVQLFASNLPKYCAVVGIAEGCDLNSARQSLPKLVDPQPRRG